MAKTVLIIDDDPGMRDVFQLIFDRAGYTAIVLNSPRSVLDGTAPSPDLYILDKQLSGVDGLDVCRFLKGQPDRRHLPVIVVSATPHVAFLAKDACADDFIEKPFRQKDLLAMVEKYLAPAV